MAPGGMGHLPLIGAARLVTGELLPVQVVLALAAGVTVGAGLLVVFGVPDRRMGCAGVTAALRAGEVPDRRSGIGTLFRLCARQGQPLPATGFAVATPSGGYHLYFTACENSVGSSEERLGRLIDVRGADGYVMAPSSCFEGRYYTLVNPGPLAPFPAWLAQLHEKPELPACSRIGNPLARVQNDTRTPGPRWPAKPAVSLPPASTRTSP
jgi:hypothetical protein